jgi:hypothetical protein
VASRLSSRGGGPRADQVHVDVIDRCRFVYVCVRPIFPHESPVAPWCEARAVADITAMIDNPESRNPAQGVHRPSVRNTYKLRRG